MGAGIAAAVATLFPEATAKDARTTKGDKNKLGSITFVEYNDKEKGDLFVINAYAQFNPGAIESGYEKEKSISIREWAIRRSMRKIKKQFAGKKIALPLIGAGIAGGSWERIEKIIWEELYGEDVTIVLWGQDSNKWLETSISCFK